MEGGVHAKFDVLSPAVCTRCCAVKRSDILGEYYDDVVRKLGDSMPPTGFQERYEAGVEQLQSEHRASATSKTHTGPYDKTDLHP